MVKEEQITKEVEETYRKLLHLYERLTTETITIGKQGEALGKIIEELKAESSLATEFKVQVRKGIMESVKKVVEEVDDQIKKSIQESITEEINKSLKEFKGVIDSSSKILCDYAKDKKVRDIWIYCGVFFCGFIFFFTAYTSLMIRKYAPTSYLTADQISTYRNGLTCENMWDRLSQKTQDRLLSINSGKLPPEENSYEWIKDKNPNMSIKDIRKKIKESND